MRRSSRERDQENLGDSGDAGEFDEEASRLALAFGLSALRIERVGSKTVPGLAAKLVVDIQVSVPSLAPHGRYVGVMATLGCRHVTRGAFDLVSPLFHKPVDRSHRADSA